MTNYAELKRLAEACGDLNWRFLTEKLTEYGIRDDHGYIAFLPVGHPAKYGACPEREAKARFLGAVTPDAVLALIAESKRLNAENEQLILLECYGGTAQAAINLLVERDQLKVENEALRKALADVRESVQREYWDEYAGLEETRAILDAAMGKGEQS